MAHPVYQAVATATTLNALLREGVAMLAANGAENAAREAVWLLESGLGRTPLELCLNGQMPVTLDDRERVLGLLSRRANREPLQYILGTQEFCGLEFLVEPAVLIPRPETELLVGEIVRCAHCLSGPIIADIGTGSGCIAVALAKALPTARLFATDCSGSALRVGLRNAERHGVQDRVRFLQGDLLEPLGRVGLEGQVSVLVSNPPYIPDGQLELLQPEVGNYEPRTALSGGPDGLAMYRRLLQDAAVFVKPGGLLVMEVGQGQAPSVCQMASRVDGYGSIRTLEDSAGIERVVCLEFCAER